MEELAPELAQQTFMACKFAEILKEYRFIVAVARLKAIKLKYYERLQYHGIDASTFVSDVMSRSYDTSGYHDGTHSSNGLERGSCKSAKDLQVCLTDTMNDEQFHIETFNRYTHEHTYPGVVKNMEKVRF